MVPEVAPAVAPVGGASVTAKVQVPAGATEVPEQVSEPTTKFATLGAMAFAPKTSAAVPVFVTVTVCDALVAPMSVPAKVKLVAPKVAWNEDGCDHDYGTPNQCVPWQIPGSTGAARCAWLESMGFGAIKVYGTNRQDLPENAQGYVCAAGA